MTNSFLYTEIIDKPGLSPYESTWKDMRDFTLTRTPETRDQIWLVEHPPVFTQGQAGLAEHILNPGDIPVIQTDRGGQITYHGPGQIVFYPLLDLARLKIGPRELVKRLEDCIIATLLEFGISAQSHCDTRGVYVNEAKIASIGLRVKRHCSYHGLSLNVDMDLSPFTRINPCGYEQLKMTQLVDLGGPSNLALVKSLLIKHWTQKNG
jgi:lipoyl(octanoyl) transferase